jgi:hypothetical protein
MREAALNSLRIFEADEDIKVAISLWGSPEEKKGSAGYRKLKEANALARLFDKAGLGSGVELPAKYKNFQKFTSEEMLKKLAKRNAAASVLKEKAAPEKKAAPEEKVKTK